jgi:hypothetical protein
MLPRTPQNLTKNCGFSSAMNLCKLLRKWAD